MTKYLKWLFADGATRAGCSRPGLGTHLAGVVVLLWLGHISPAAAQVTVSLSPGLAALMAGQSQQFTATVIGSANSAVTWSISPSAGSISLTGLYTAPASVASQQVVTVRATSVADPSKFATSPVTLLSSGVTVQVSPASATLSAGQSRQFAATVTGNANTAVTWSVSPSVGSISSAGVYSAPANLNVSQTVTVTATSQADPSKSANASVTLTAVSVAITPGSVTLSPAQTAQFAATVSGSSNTGVTWSVSPNVGSISSGGLYTAPSQTASQVIMVTATSQADPSKTAHATVNLVAVALGVAPQSATLTAGQTQQFVATVTGSSDTSVTWSITPNVGSISSAGIYTAPSILNATQTVTVTATSRADNTKSASARVTLSAITVAITPGTVTLSPAQTVQFVAAVTGTANTGVTWSLSPKVGAVTSTGLYTAPAVIANSQQITITAASQADPSKSASAVIVLPAIAVNVSPVAVMLNAGQSRQFTAAVTGSSDTAVAWSLSPNIGSLSSTGLYEAPALVNATQQVTVTATSRADPSKSASVLITIFAVGVSIAPESATLTAGQRQQFNASVTGAANPAVTWTLIPNVGAISANGLYSAPQVLNNSLQISVIATSQADTTKSATASVTLSAVSLTVSPSSVTLNVGQAQQFAAVVSGTSDTRVRWSLSPNAGSISALGRYTAPTSVIEPQQVTVTATSEADPSKLANATIALVPVTIVISPASATLGAGQSQQFSTTVTGTANTAVTWSIAPSLGTISGSGVYTAPSVVSGSQQLTVTATSQADPSKSASANVTLAATGVNISPSAVVLTSAQTQQFSAVVTGAANTAITWSIAPNVGSISSTGLYTAPNPIAGSLQVTVTATSNADTSKSASATITLTAVAISISPQAIALRAGQTAQFTAAVTGASNTSVTWSLRPNIGGISIAGLYTAPSAVTANQQVTVIATSQAEPGKAASATVTLTAVGLTISPLSTTLSGGQSQQFTAEVTGVSDTSVTWSVSPNVGGISTNGLYTAPGIITTAQQLTVTATSRVDPSKSASATVALSAIGVTISPTLSTLSAGQFQQFTASASGGANTAVTWSIAPQTGTISSTGLYSAPAIVAASQQVTVTATSRADPSKSASATITLRASLPAAPALSIAVDAQPITITDQPKLTLYLSPSYPLPVDVKIGLSFAANASGLASGNSSGTAVSASPAVQFASGGTSYTISVPANTSTIQLPGVQIGDVSGRITVSITGLEVSQGGPALSVPSPEPRVIIDVPRLAPVVAPGSLRVTSVSDSGFTVRLVASSTTRDLSGITITFAVVGSAQANGTRFTIAVDKESSAWFSSAAGQAAGGSFELRIPFTFSGALHAISSVSVTLTNSVATSEAVLTTL